MEILHIWGFLSLVAHKISQVVETNNWTAARGTINSHILHRKVNGSDRTRNDKYQKWPGNIAISSSLASIYRLQFRTFLLCAQGRLHGRDARASSAWGRPVCLTTTERLSVHFHDVRVCTCYTDISTLFVLQYTLRSSPLIRPSHSVFPRV